MQEFTLRKGNKGQEIRRVQVALAVDAGAALGTFGPLTETAVNVAKAAAGLPEDGIVDGATYAAISVPQPVRCIDTSRYQGKVDFAAALAGGTHACWERLTQGSTYVDPFGLPNVTAAKAANMPVGSYHFATPGESDAQTQASHFLDAQTKAQPTLCRALDLEQDGKKTPGQLARWVMDWFSLTALPENDVSMLYTTRSLLAVLNAGGFVKPDGCYLWIANPNGQSDDPDVDPAPFPEWTLWQDNWHGHVDGISTEVDLDWLSGGAPMLEKLRLPMLDGPGY